MTGGQDFLRRQSEIIDRVGRAVTLVLPGVDDADHSGPFAYTVGLAAHDHPELRIARLRPATAQALLNDLARRVHDRGERFDHGKHVSDLIADHDAVIVAGPVTGQFYPGAACARYGVARVRLRQIVWPDPRGRFPWDNHYAYRPDVQPLIGCP